MAKECHCTEYNIISGNYLGVTTLGDVGTTHTGLMNAAMPFFVDYMVSNQEHPCILLAKIFSQRRRKFESDGLIALLSH